MFLKIVEYETDDGIEYGFYGLDYWEDFDMLVKIISNNLNAIVIEKSEGPYSRYCKFSKQKIEFRLLYHPELGNTISAIYQSNHNSKYLKKLAQEVLSIVNLR